MDILDKGVISLGRAGMEELVTHITIPHNTYQPGKYHQYGLSNAVKLTVIPGNHLVRPINIKLKTKKQHAYLEGRNLFKTRLMMP